MRARNRTEPAGCPTGLERPHKIEGDPSGQDAIDHKEKDRTTHRSGLPISHKLRQARVLGEDRYRPVLIRVHSRFIRRWVAAS
jgi:hypothetical protein